MKDDAVIKDNEAVYLLNEQTYLHLRENLEGVGYEVFDKNSPLPVEEGQICLLYTSPSPRDRG